MSLKFEDYVSRISPASGVDQSRILEQVLDEMNDGVDLHLNEIAEELIDEAEVAAKLGLKPRQLRDIQWKLPNNKIEQR